jgi:hypothetical protein
MQILLGILAFASLGMILVGLRDPTGALFWYKGARTIKTVLRFYGIAFVTSVFAFNILFQFEKWQVRQRQINPVVGRDSVSIENFWESTPFDTSKVALETTSSIIKSPFIPGLGPVDVYLNLEGKGFETTKLFSNYSNEWISRKDEDGMLLIVSTQNNGGAETVDRVKVTATVIDFENRDISESLEFFRYLSSVPFTGNDPQRLLNWLDKQFNKKKSTITVSGVKFTLTSAAYARIMTIEVAE